MGPWLVQIIRPSFDWQWRRGIQRVEAIFHQGACSNTLLDDGGQQLHMLKEILGYAIEQGAPRVLLSRRPSQCIQER
jgi:hypothetical protein